MSSAEGRSRRPYEIRYSAAAARRLRGGVASRGQIRNGARLLAIRAALHAGSLRCRTARGALVDAGRIADGVTIDWIRHLDGGFFVVRAGFELMACDVLPEQRAVLVLVIAGRAELAERLALRMNRPKAVPVGPFGWGP